MLRLQFAALVKRVERKLRWQPPHLDHPVNRFARPFPVETARRIADNGRDTKIRVRRQPPIQAHLLAASMFAGRER